MIKKIGIGAAIVGAAVIFAACSAPAPAAEPAPAPATPPAANPAPTPEPEPAPSPSPEPEPPAPAPDAEWVLNPGPRPDGPIAATWIQVDVDQENQTVSLPVSAIEENWNIHFKLETTEGEINFMAYIYGGEVFVRANVCPPCRSIGFALDEDADLLICDRCATLFEPGTGDGIEGACVNYPKAEVAYQVVDGDMIIKASDLLDAYQETLMPG